MEIVYADECITSLRMLVSYANICCCLEGATLFVTTDSGFKRCNAGEGRCKAAYCPGPPCYPASYWISLFIETEILLLLSSTVWMPDEATTHMFVVQSVNFMV
jgi:hypothetical protein